MSLKRLHNRKRAETQEKHSEVACQGFNNGDPPEGKAGKYIFLYARKEGNETEFSSATSFLSQAFSTEVWHSKGPG